jgi:predicted nuclease with RNAse H fold
MAGRVVVGIDLAGSSRRATGGCVLRGLRAETSVLFDDAEIVAFVRSARPELVTIDAPLHLPPGRRTIEDRNGAHFRPCDIALRELGIPFFPITLGPMRMLTVRGIALKKRLSRAGFRVLEMYPGGAQDVWNIPRARRDRAGIRGLAEDATADELDAATGALVGRLHLLGRARMLGDERTGAILLPRARIRRSASRA